VPDDGRQKLNEGESNAPTHQTSAIAGAADSHEQVLHPRRQAVARSDGHEGPHRAEEFQEEVVNLQTLKPGDFVWIGVPPANPRKRMVKVTSVTKCQIVTATGQRYRRANGSPIGFSHTYRITDVATEHELNQYRAQGEEEKQKSQQREEQRNRLGLKVLEIQMRLPDTLINAVASLSEFPKSNGPAEQYDIRIGNMSHGRAMVLAQILNEAVASGRVPEFETATLKPTGGSRGRQ
jgi:hypothetical protein